MAAEKMVNTQNFDFVNVRLSKRLHVEVRRKRGVTSWALLPEIPTKVEQ